MQNKKIEWALSALKDSCKGQAHKSPELKILEEEILKLEKKNNDLKSELGGLRKHIRIFAEHAGIEHPDSLSPYHQLNQFASHWRNVIFEQVDKIEVYEKKIEELRNNKNRSNMVIGVGPCVPAGEYLTIVKIGAGGGSK